MVDRRKVAFIGLGVMGYPMAGHLAAAGHDVTVYNRTAAKTEKWLAQHGGAAAVTPAAAAQGAEIVMTCVGNDDDLRAVVLGDDGAFAGLASGAVYVDHTTVSADIARELAVLGLERGIGVLDAPVSGGQAGAENGALTVMVGGDADAFARAAPVMAAYGRSVVHLGEAGNGQLAKMVNQICIAGLVQGLSEGINFGRRAGQN
jgi:3-hydroxyisobutyrate dehydrogenase